MYLYPHRHTHSLHLWCLTLGDLGGWLLRGEEERKWSRHDPNPVNRDPFPIRFIFCHSTDTFPDLYQLNNKKSKILFHIVNAVLLLLLYCCVLCIQLRTDGYNELARVYYTFTISKKMRCCFGCFTLFFPYWMTAITLLCHSRFSLVSFRDPGWMDGWWWWSLLYVFFMLGYTKMTGSWSAFISICSIVPVSLETRDNFSEQNIFLHLVLSLNGFHHDNNNVY